MQKQILAELTALRQAVVLLAGSEELPPEQQLSEKALQKAAKEFKKLNTARNGWVAESDLGRIFKDVHYGVGKFLREELQFSQYFIKGKSHYYNRKALLQLVRELKDRKVNLARYIEYKHDKEKFEAKLKTAAAKKKLAAFLLPTDMHEIETSETPKPAKQLITSELKRLKDEFEEQQMGQYIDIYKTFAMMKFDYHFSKFRDATYRARCKTWIENFNYVNRALDLLNGRGN